MGGIKDLDELEQSGKKEAFIKAADLKKSAKGKGGRPKKSEDEKATSQVFVNLTAAEKERVQAYAKKMGVGVSPLLKMLLAEKGIFKRT
jgi:hypothetical protein